jgi:hypothetical protein
MNTEMLLELKTNAWGIILVFGLGLIALIMIIYAQANPSEETYKKIESYFIKINNEVYHKRGLHWTVTEDL